MGLENMLVSTSFLASEYLSAPNVSFKLFWKRKERQHSVLAGCGGRGTQTDPIGETAAHQSQILSFPANPFINQKVHAKLGFASQQLQQDYTESS